MQTSKWWAVEIRFVRALTRREIRKLTKSLKQTSPGEIGTDGFVTDQWWNKWPGEYDGEILLNAIRRIGIPARIRHAYRGRDCECVDFDRACTTRSNAASCAPVLREEDWISIDTMRV